MRFRARKHQRQTLENIAERHSFEKIKPEYKGSGKFHRSATPGKWRDSFTQKEKDVMESIMGTTLRKVGYQ